MKTTLLPGQDIAYYTVAIPRLYNDYVMAIANAYRPDNDNAVEILEEMSDRLDAALQILYKRRSKCPDAQNMGQFACDNRHQCWEACGELGNSVEHVQVAPPCQHFSGADAVLRRMPEPNAVGFIEEPVGQPWHRRFWSWMRA